MFGGARLSLSDSDAFKQLWFVEPFGGEDTYRLRNIRSGTFLSLKNGLSILHAAKCNTETMYGLGSSASETPIQGHAYTGTNEEWVIHKENSYYKLVLYMTDIYKY